MGNFNFDGEKLNFGKRIPSLVEKISILREKISILGKKKWISQIFDKLFSTMYRFFEVWQRNFGSFGSETFVLSGALCKPPKIFLANKILILNGKIPIWTEKNGILGREFQVRGRKLQF